MLTFLPKPLPDRLSWWVGAVEVEPLFLEKPGGEVFVRDVSSTKRLWRVAKNSRNFLLALPIAAKFLGQCAIDEVDFEDSGAAGAIARECANTSGGNKYLAFYSMLLG